MKACSRLAARPTRCRPPSDRTGREEARPGVAWLGEAGRGRAWCGEAGHGAAWQGRPGHFADVTPFNPERVIDRATYTEPFRYDEGIEYMVVNGRLAVSRAENLLCRESRRAEGVRADFNLQS